MADMTNDITSGTAINIEAGCGNEASSCIFDFSYVFDTQQPDYNLLSSMQASIRSSPISWTGQHVKGHQDDHAGALNYWIVLNIKMDQMTKAYWQHLANLLHDRLKPYGFIY
jgi:hypothetical protein